MGASYQSSIYLFGGQGAYTEALDGTNGGFPVLNEVMVYAPLTYTVAEVTALLIESQANSTALAARVGELESTVASHALTVDTLQTQLDALSATVGRIDTACLAPAAGSDSNNNPHRDRRAAGCAASSTSSGGGTSSDAAVYAGVAVAVVVAVVAAVGVVMWSRKSGVAHPHKQLDGNEQVVNPVFYTADNVAE